MIWVLQLVYFNLTLMTQDSYTNFKNNIKSVNNNIKNYNNTHFIDKLLLKLVKNGVDEDSKGELKERLLDNQSSLSIRTLTSNFKHLSSKLSLFFSLHYGIIHILSWKRPPKTWSFLLFYTSICLYPHLILAYPLIIILFSLIIPNFFFRHPMNTPELIIVKKRGTSLFSWLVEEKIAGGDYAGITAGGANGNTAGGGNSHRGAAGAGGGLGLGGGNGVNSGFGDSADFNNFGDSADSATFGDSADFASGNLNSTGNDRNTVSVGNLTKSIKNNLDNDISGNSDTSLGNSINTSFNSNVSNSIDNFTNASNSIDNFTNVSNSIDNSTSLRNSIDDSKLSAFDSSDVNSSVNDKGGDTFTHPQIKTEQPPSQSVIKNQVTLLMNMRDLQNLTSDLIKTIDLIEGYYYETIGFEHEKLSTFVFFITLILITFIFLLGPFIPWRGIFISSGWIVLVLLNPNVKLYIADLKLKKANAAKLKPKVEEKLPSDPLEEFKIKLNNHIIVDDEPEIKFVEMWELQTKSILKIDWNFYCYSNSTFSKKDFKRINGNRPKGVDSLTKIYPPSGWKFDFGFQNKWQIDNNTDKLIKQRFNFDNTLFTKNESDGWIYDTTSKIDKDINIEFRRRRFYRECFRYARNSKDLDLLNE